jgi:membrane fusion protein
VSESSLFRSEALLAQGAQCHGEIVMTHPPAHGFMAALFASLGAALIAFALWGTYTKRVAVTGQLVPTKGLIKVYVQQTGTVVEERVIEGQHVNPGDVLFALSSERQSSTMGETQAAISRDTRARELSLREELAKTEQMRRLERDSLVQKIAGLKTELHELSGMIEDQRSRYELSGADYRRYLGIVDKGYVTHDQLTQREGDEIDQKSRLKTLERDQITTQRNLDDAQYQLTTLGIKYDNQIGDITRNTATAEQDLSESEARRRLIVVAPESGIATAINVHLGQAVDVNKPVVAILPVGSQLQAELYAPSRAIGFIKLGSVVRMRYQAYPFEKFGQYSGTVIGIANTTLSSTELTGSEVFGASGQQQSEPLYRILVRLQSQTVTAYGEPRALKAGMLLEANVLQERRRLYEWVLEPLYSVTGKL